jgi:hypothetical protein
MERVLDDDAGAASYGKVSTAIGKLEVQESGAVCRSGTVSQSGCDGYLGAG